jgi:5-methyltetrahydrofolate--homocysteine methyltransferase
MNSILQYRIERRPVLTDGAWGTQLQARGLAPGEFPDAWNVSHPDRVAEVARAYVAAGSELILTNTFGANPIRLAEAGLRGQIREINRAGVEISRSAAAGGALVFASMGPSGKMLLDGNITAGELLDAFAEQARILAAAGADGLVIETMSDLEEAKLAVQGARGAGLPVVACMVFDCGKAKDRTMMGETPEMAARGLSEAGADVIGANCGQGIAGFAPICRRLKAATDRPIWIKANAGLPEWVEGMAVYRTSPEAFSRWIPDLLEAGADFVGGCCGTTPEFIRAAAEKLKT